MKETNNKTTKSNTKTTIQTESVSDSSHISSTTYSGELDIEDFNTYSPNKQRINKQMEAIHLKEQLEKEQEKRKMMENYKNMTLEELRKKKLISNTDGRPLSSLTDEKWQKEFEIRKLFVTPGSEKNELMGGNFSKESGIWSKDGTTEYYGATNWQQYCSYINDVLRNIRSGQIDYCYFIYQIMDLVKFEYNALRTKYRDGYWEIWLDR